MNIVGYVFLGLLAVLVVIALILFVVAIPDLARYSRIRKM
jgi:hypothetical protein